MGIKRSKKGFTIIEVVLVLAIAGLIFLAVFIALPALQRAQRNTERRNNISMMKAAFMEWSKNNSITVADGYADRYKPNGFCSFYSKYLHDLVDPNTGEPYKAALWGTTRVVDCVNKREIDRKKYDPDVHGSGISNQGNNWALMEVGDIQFDDTAVCSEDGGFNDDVSSYSDNGNYVHSGTRLFAIRIKLEGGATLCVDGEYQ
jgi:prepilin-type N-terminal cleavage/methylation domain-containing protein